MSQPSPVSLSKKFLAENSRGRAGSDPSAYAFSKRRREIVSLLKVGVSLGRLHQLYEYAQKFVMRELVNSYYMHNNFYPLLQLCICQ